MKNADIFEALSKRTNPASEILSCYLSPKIKEGAEDTAGVQLCVEYLDQASLDSFLFQRKKEECGILQRFVDPKGPHNNVIRAIWSPNMIFLERRENVNRIGDSSYNAYERAVTYEGAEHLSRTSPIRSKTLIAQFNSLCQNIADHVREITQGKTAINRMVLTFKIDAEDRIWLLWCSSIRLDSGGSPTRPLDLTRPVPAEPELPEPTVGSKPETQYFPMLKKKYAQCPVTGETVEEAQLIDIPMKKIIGGFKRSTGATLDDAQFDEVQSRLEELQLPQDEQGVESLLNTCLPRAVRITFPKLDLANFRRLLKDPVFLSTPIKISEDAYLDLTQEKKVERFPDIKAKPGTPEYEAEYETQHIDEGDMMGDAPHNGPQQAWGDQGRTKNSTKKSTGGPLIKAPQPAVNDGIRLSNRPTKTQLGGNFPSTGYPRSSSPPPQPNEGPQMNESYMSSLQKALSLANHLQGVNYSDLDPLAGLSQDEMAQSQGQVPPQVATSQSHIAAGGIQQAPKELAPVKPPWRISTQSALKQHSINTQQNSTNSSQQTTTPQQQTNTQNSTQKYLTIGHDSTTSAHDNTTTAKHHSKQHPNSLSIITPTTLSISSTTTL